MVDEVELATVADHPVLLLQSHGRAHRGADGNPSAMRCDATQIQAAVRYRLPRRDDGELRCPIQAPYLLRPQPVLPGIEVHLGRDPGTERGRIEEGNPPGRRPAFAEKTPEALDSDSPRRQHAHSRDDYP